MRQVVQALPQQTQPKPPKSPQRKRPNDVSGGQRTRDDVSGLEREELLFQVAFRGENSPLTKSTKEHRSLATITPRTLKFAAKLNRARRRTEIISWPKPKLKPAKETRIHHTATTLELDQMHKLQRRPPQHVSRSPESQSRAIRSPR